MRKIYFTLFVVFMFLITGCTTTPDNNNEKQLNNPEVSDYKNNTIYWNSVSDSDGYIIRINNIEYEVNGLFYQVEFEETQEFTFAIKAKGKTNISKDSDWSTTVTYTYTAPSVITKLQVPTISRYKENIVYWNEVNDSNGYVVKINNIEYTTSDLFYEIEFEETQEFTFAIKAKGLSGVSEDSDWSEVNTFTYTAPVVISKLPVPTIKSYKENVVYWNEVKDTNGYVVKINNVEYTTNDLFYEIQFEETQEFTLAIKALGKAGISEDSDWSEVNTFTYTSPVVIRKLPVPTIKNYKENIVYWNEVNDSDGYIVKINNNEYFTNELFFVVEFVDTREFTFAVKAKGKTGISDDSEWSNEYTYTYVSLIKLQIPIIDSYIDNTLKWDKIEGAIAYCLEINGLVINTSKTEYLVSFEDDCDFEVRIRSIGHKDYGTIDSNWSYLETYKFTLKGDFGDNHDEVLKYGIGYGFDFTKNGTLDLTFKKASSILDLNKIATFATVIPTPAQMKSSNTIYYEETIMDLMTKLNVDFKAEIGGNIPIEGISVGLQAALDFYAQFKTSGHVGGNFLTIHMVKALNSYVLQNYGGVEKLSKYLSQDFKDILNRNNSNLKGLSDRELAEYIVDNYGTHVVIGVQTGAIYDFYYGAITKDKNVASQLGSVFEEYASAKFGNIADANEEKGLNVAIENSYQKHKTYYSSTEYSNGGSIDFDSTNIKPAEINNQINNCTFKVDESNAVPIAITDDGVLSLADLIYFINPDLSYEIINVINERKNEDYLSMFEDYKFADGSEEQPYHAENYEELASFLNDVVYNGKYIELTGDIHLSDVEDKKGPIFEKLRANIIGNGHTIDGLSMSLKGGVTGYYGIFGEICDDGSIKDVVLKYNDIIYNDYGDYSNGYSTYVGILCGINRGVVTNVDVEKCTISINIGSTDYDADYISSIGIIAGINENIIELCDVKESTCYSSTHTKGYAANSYSGGICGIARNNSKITTCSVSDCTISAYCLGCASHFISTVWSARTRSYCGGIVGEMSDSIIEKTSSINNVIKSTVEGAVPDLCEAYSGGIIGIAFNSSISNCSSNNKEINSTENSQYQNWFDDSHKKVYEGEICGEAISSTIY